MSARRHLTSVADVLDAVHRWVEWRTGKGGVRMSAEERDLLGAWHRCEVQRTKPASVPPKAGFAPEEAPTKTAPKMKPAG